MSSSKQLENKYLDCMPLLEKNNKETICLNLYRTEEFENFCFDDELIDNSIVTYIRFIKNISERTLKRLLEVVIPKNIESIKRIEVQNTDEKLEKVICALLLNSKSMKFVKIELTKNDNNVELLLLAMINSSLNDLDLETDDVNEEVLLDLLSKNSNLTSLKLKIRRGSYDYTNIIEKGKFLLNLTIILTSNNK